MKKIRLVDALAALAVLAASSFAIPAFADTNNTSIAGATAGATAGASAGATLNQGNTTNYANGGIGAAACANSVGTPVFSFSTSLKRCEIMTGALAMEQQGLITKAEARAFGLYALGMGVNGVVLVYPPAAATTSTSTMSAPANTTQPAALAPTMSVNGPWEKLSRSQQKRVCAGELYWNNSLTICQ